MLCEGDQWGNWQGFWSGARERGDPTCEQSSSILLSLEMGCIVTAPLRRFVTIVAGFIGLACLLGICLDAVTANVAVDYFSVYHPRIVPTNNSWILAVVWGVAASWWFGAIAGVIVATVNHLRPCPLEPARILKWARIACLVLWLLMMTILLAVLAIASTIPLEERKETFDHDRRLMAVAMAHQYEYLLGAMALLVLSIMTWRCGTQGKTVDGRDGQRTDAPESPRT